ncbi:Nucleoskeletal protein [Scheffersomyces xylosifermentans]|uniref:Nucleoskeletal protein n=1 Tax=Scheffersomyces xylosifermentans TaxID=1304137 RepID=UPI00315C9EFC
MSSNYSKRSVSPFSEETRSSKKPGNSIISKVASVFNFFKDKVPQSKEFRGVKTDVAFPGYADVKMVVDEPLQNDFSSEKKKRLSIQGHPSSGYIPRSSSLSNNLGLYQSYANNIQTTKEEMHNDMERRLSTSYGNGIVKDSVNLDAPRIINRISRDASPLGDILESQAIEMDTSTTESVDGRNSVIIEPEYAPLYTDDEGNLVRPPFINLDPRERHRLLQLKRSMETSEALQRRIRYMVDPNETASHYINKTHLVETSTQTHDINFLERSLNFKRKRPVPPTKFIKNTKRLKNSQGFYVGEFYYDVDNIESKPKSTNKLDGYLGKVSNPSFNDESQNQSSKFTTVTRNSDDNDAFASFATMRKRDGLESKLSNKGGLTLDSSYIEKSKQYSNVIKLKDDSKESAEIRKKDSSTPGPSSGFKFKIKEDDIDSIIQKRKEDDELVEKSKLSSTFSLGDKMKNNPITPVIGGSIEETNKDVPLFGKDRTTEPSKSVAVPSFSFGKQLDNSSNTLFNFGKTDKKSQSSKKEGTPLFSLPTNDAKINDKPASSSSQTADESTKPKESMFGSKPSDENEKDSQSKPSPLFSFGASTTSDGIKDTQDTKDTKEQQNKPLFSFGKQTDTGSDSSKSTFTFGSTKKDDNTEDKTTFSFEVPKKDESSTPALFSSGSDKKVEGLFSIPPMSKPTIKFGGKDSEVSSTTADPKPKRKISDVTSGDEKAATPTFSFGGKPQTDTPAFSFGAPSSGEKKELTPTFSFGNTSGEKAPSFTTGAPTTKTEENRPATGPVATAFSFGGSAPSTATPLSNKPSASTPAFSFGAPSSEKKDDAEPANKKPAFTFGGAASSTPFSTAKPAFSFGESTPQPSSVFGVNGAKDTTPQPSSSSTPQPFSFSQPTIPNSNPNFKFAAGIVAGAPPATNFKFGQPQNTSFGGTPAFGGTNNNSNPNLSRSTTPTSFGFGAPATTNPAAVFGQNTNAAPSFNFGTSTSKEGTPDPSAIFGMNKGPSRESTPFSFGSNPVNSNPASVFGANNGPNSLSMPVPGNAFGMGGGQPAFGFGGPAAPGPGGVPNQTPTPPLLNRKIAHMRQRRR